MQLDDQSDVPSDEPNAGLVNSELRGVATGSFEEEETPQDASHAATLREEASNVSSFSPPLPSPVKETPVSFNASAKESDTVVYTPRTTGSVNGSKPVEEVIPPATNTQEQETEAVPQDSNDLLDDSEDVANETQAITFQDEVQVHAPVPYLSEEVKPRPKVKNATATSVVTTQNASHPEGNASAAVPSAWKPHLKLSNSHSAPRKSLASTATSVAASKEKAEEAKAKAEAAEQAAELANLRAENAAYAKANSAYGARIAEMVRMANKKKKKSLMNSAAPPSTSARARPKGWDQCLRFTRHMKSKGVTGTELIKVWRGTCTPAITENRASERYKLMCNSLGGALTPFAAQIDYNVDDLCDAVLAIFHDVTAVDVKPGR